MGQKSATATADPGWAAFEAEALPHLDRLFRLAMWLERNRPEAEGLVQETKMQALQSFHRFRAGTNCRAWLTTILQNVRMLTETNHEILRHLETCPVCRADLAGRR